MSLVFWVDVQVYPLVVTAGRVFAWLRSQDGVNALGSGAAMSWKARAWVASGVAMAAMCWTCPAVSIWTVAR